MQTLADARHLPVRSLQNLTGSNLELGRDCCAHGSIRRAWVDQKSRVRRDGGALVTKMGDTVASDIVFPKIDVTTCAS